MSVIGQYRDLWLIQHALYTCTCSIFTLYNIWNIGTCVWLYNYHNWYNKPQYIEYRYPCLIQYIELWLIQDGTPSWHYTVYSPVEYEYIEYRHLYMYIYMYIEYRHHCLYNTYNIGTCDLLYMYIDYRYHGLQHWWLTCTCMYVYTYT